MSDHKLINVARNMYIGCEKNVNPLAQQCDLLKCVQASSFHPNLRDPGITIA